MPNLSVLSPGKLILDILGKHIVRYFFKSLEFKISTFLEKMDLRLILRCLLRGGWMGPAQAPAQALGNGNGTEMEPKPPELIFNLKPP